MTNDAEDVDKNFNKFVESMYQYVKEPIKDFAVIKPQLLDIFKTHRPVRTVDYQYGISKSLKGKSQLIIHEFNQRSLVREYFKTGKNDWNCCECTRTSTTVSKDDGIFDLLNEHGIIFVKLEHECAGRDISFVQKVQKLYKEKKVEEVDSLQKSVLGSEDSIVPVKDTAAKRGTIACSSKLAEEIIAEVRLRLAQRQLNDDQEDELSTMDEKFDESQEKLSPEEAFSKIIENLKEYTNETKEVVMANKLKILTYLKTHRPIKMCNYQYGLLQNLRSNKRLMVFEWNDRKRVRDYSNKIDRPHIWHCLNCVTLYNKKSSESYSYLYFIDGIVFVPIYHNSECKPKDYELVMIYQKFLEEGDTTKAWAMVKTFNFTYGETNLTNYKNFLADGNPIETDDNENNAKILAKRKMVSDRFSLHENCPAYKRSKLYKSTLVNALDNTVIDENDSVLFDEDLSVCNKLKTKKNQKHHFDDKVDFLTHSKSESSTSITTTSIYHFEKPSTSKLEKICVKLTIEYRNKVVKFWDKIIFEQIDTVSMPSSNMKTHFFETYNFYQILSIFFTGKSKQHEQIKTAIIDAFREKLVSSGQLSIKKFNKRYLDTVTDEHFAFISKFLSCRILIFDGENGIKKYGKWKSTTSTRLTLVVAFKEGYYSIVLSL